MRSPGRPLQDRARRLFEADAVVVGHPVVAVDGRALEQEPGEVEPDESGGPGDEVNASLVFAHCLSLWVAQGWFRILLASY